MLFSAANDSSSLHNVLHLPESLEFIEAEAFSGDDNVDMVVIPYGTASIGSQAFAHSGIQHIYIPETAQYIAPDAFTGAEGVEIHAPSLSYAQEYTQKMGFSFDAVQNTAYVSFGTTEIGEGAYSGIQYVYIPDTVTAIHENAFLDTQPGFTFCCAEDSFAHDWAVAHGILWRDAGNYYTRYYLEQLMEISDEENTDPVDYSLDIVYLDTENITAPEIISEISAINDLQSRLAQSMEQNEEYGQQFADGLEELSNAIQTDSLQFSEDKLIIQTPSGSYTASIANTEYISDDAKILSVQTTEDESSMLVTVENSDGTISYIQSSESGFTVSDVLPPAASNMRYMRSTGFAAQKQSDWILSAVRSFTEITEKIKYAVLTLDRTADTILNKASTDLELAKASLTRAQKLQELYPDKVIFSRKDMLSMQENVNKLSKRLEATKKLSNIWGRISKSINVVSIMNDLFNISDLIAIGGHGHPTKEESEDSEKRYLANEISERLLPAELLLFGSIAYSIFEMCDKLDPVITLASVASGPLGIGTKLATTLSIKAAKRIITRELTRIGASIVVNESASIRYKQVMDADRALHKSKPAPTPTPKPTPTPTPKPTPTPTPTPTPVEYGWIQGYVRDGNNNPVAGAKVSVNNSAYYTDSLGWYKIRLPLGRYWISFIKTGYIGRGFWASSGSEASGYYVSKIYTESEGYDLGYYGASLFTEPSTHSVLCNYTSENNGIITINISSNIDLSYYFTPSQLSSIHVYDCNTGGLIGTFDHSINGATQLSLRVSLRAGQRIRFVLPGNQHSTLWYIDI